VKHQKQFVEHLRKGWSATMVCAHTGLSLDSARLTLAIDERFRRKCAEVSDVLTENIRASLYSKALKGTISAQALWFREDAARRAACQEELPVSPDELLAEIERVSLVFRSLQQQTDPK
jgi:hypothetical protein